MMDLSSEGSAWSQDGRRIISCDGRPHESAVPYRQECAMAHKNCRRTAMCLTQLMILHTPSCSAYASGAALIATPRGCRSTWAQGHLQRQRSRHPVGWAHACMSTCGAITVLGECSMHRDGRPEACSPHAVSCSGGLPSSSFSSGQHLGYGRCVALVMCGVVVVYIAVENCSSPYFKLARDCTSLADRIACLRSLGHALVGEWGAGNGSPRCAAVLGSKAR
jgi:hypothetical protein